MSSEARRKAVRRYGRRQASGVFLGVLCLAAFFFIAAHSRHWLIAHIGETGFLWGFGIMSFASFLVPPFLLQCRAIKDKWLYCPHCNNFLGAIRAVIPLNKHSQCSNCSRVIEISPIDKRGARYDMTYILGGLWFVLGVMYAVSLVIPAS